MTYITLAVTGPVIRQVSAGNLFQRQISIQDASPELRSVIGVATAEKQVPVAVNGVFELSVGDRGAIWGAHQRAGLQAEDFTSLYDLLARRPDTPVRFEWE